MVNALMERILVKFTKINNIKFISHLDTMRTLNRAMRRAGIDIMYSCGFNPHASISVAAPLQLGIESVSEYADINIQSTVDLEKFKDSLNKALPLGLKIVEAVKIEGKKPSSMGSVAAASYSIKMKAMETTEDEIKKVIGNIMSQKEIVRLKRTKSGEKDVDVRPFIIDIKYVDLCEEELSLRLLLCTGSRGNISPQMVAEIIEDFSNKSICNAYSIVREEIYAQKNEKLIDLCSYLLGE